LGTDAYPRLRVGIGDNFPKGRQVNFVLGKWSEDEKAELPHLLTRVGDTVKAFATMGLERAMNVAGSGAGKAKP
jgi:PTH1 family peptidyl-tRNA hydrolase